MKKESLSHMRTTIGHLPIPELFIDFHSQREALAEEQGCALNVLYDRMSKGPFCKK